MFMAASPISECKILDLIFATGDNGTIDGQGLIWWEWFSSQSLNYSRPHLLELVNCNDIVVSNLTFLNSPAWSIHPVYCRYIMDPVSLVLSSKVSGLFFFFGIGIGIFLTKESCSCDAEMLRFRT